MKKIKEKANKLIEAFELCEVRKMKDINKKTSHYTFTKHSSKLNACRSAIKHIELIKTLLNKSDLLFYNKVKDFIIIELKHLL